MKIQVVDLEREPVYVDSSISAAELSFEQVDALLKDAVDVTATVSKQDDQVRVAGQLKTSITFVCNRCLKEFRQPLNRAFDLTYLPVALLRRQEDEVEVSYQNLDIGFFDGVELDLNVLLVEQIMLSLPMKPVCQAGCKGLCPVCGIDLNARACECRSLPGDPRRAPLAALREKLKKH